MGEEIKQELAILKSAQKVNRTQIQHLENRVNQLEQKLMAYMERGELE